MLRISSLLAGLALLTVTVLSSGCLKNDGLEELGGVSATSTDRAGRGFDNGMLSDLDEQLAAQRIVPLTDPAIIPDLADQLFNGISLPDTVGKTLYLLRASFESQDTPRHKSYEAFIDEDEERVIFRARFKVPVGGSGMIGWSILLCGHTKRVR